MTETHMQKLTDAGLVIATLISVAVVAMFIAKGFTPW